MTEQKQLPDSFENSMKELEAIVENMEQGDLSLDEALTKFERGIALVKHSQHALDKAEQKIKILLQNKQSDELVDWQEPDSN